MPRAIIVVIAFAIAGCAEYQYTGMGLPIGKQRAMDIVFAEFKRRGIAVQPRWQIKITADIRVQEAEPQEVPLYAIDVYDPVLSSRAPLYVIDLHRYTGAVYLFSKMDVRGYNRRYHRSNHTMQPTAGRSDASLHFMKTRSLQSTLAFASGG